MKLSVCVSTWTKHFFLSFCSLRLHAPHFGPNESRPRSQVARNFLEFVDGVVPIIFKWLRQVIKTIVQMVLDESLLGLMNGFFYRLQLLRDVETATTVLDHLNGAVEMPAGTAQSFDNCGVRFMCVKLCHVKSIPWGRML